MEEDYLELDSIGLEMSARNTTLLLYEQYRH